MNEDVRAVSPVVGAVLMIGIVVALAGIVGAIFMGIGETGEPTPDAAMDLETPDDGVGYDLKHNGGDQLRGGQLQIEGATHMGSTEDLSLAAGESTQLQPTKDEVQLLWLDNDTGRTFVLQEFDVEESSLPTDSGGTTIEPDAGCDALVFNGGSDFDTATQIRVPSGKTVACSFETDADVIVESGATLVGDTDTSAEFDLDGETYGTVNATQLDVADGIYSEANFQVAELAATQWTDVEIDGSIAVDGTGDLDFDLEGTTDLDGDVTLRRDGQVDVSTNGGGERIGGDLTLESGSGNDVTLDFSNGGEIGGSVNVDSAQQADLDLSSGTTVGESVSFESDDQTDVDLSGGAEIGGDLEGVADGQIQVQTNNMGDTVKGAIDLESTTSGDSVTVDFSNGGTIEGPITTTSGGQSDIDLKTGATVEGGVDVDTGDQADLDLSGGAEIDGDAALEADGQVQVQTNNPGDTIKGGLDLESTTSGDDVTVDFSNGGTVEGPITSTSGGQSDIDLKTGATVEGGVSVDTGDQADLDLSGGAEIDGDATIEADGQVQVQTNGGTDVIKGDLDLTSTTSGDDLTVDLSNGGTVEGSISTDSGGQADLDLDSGATVEGGVNVDTDGQADLDLQGTSTIKNDVTITGGTFNQMAMSGSAEIDGSLDVDVSGTIQDDDFDLASGATIDGDADVLADNYDTEPAVENDIDPATTGTVTLTTR